jgi:SulP family sulfate permease
MLAASFIAWFFELDEKGVALVQSSPAGLPGLHLPTLDFSIISTLLGPAVVLAMVSFAETYSVSKAISNQTRQKVNVDQEFIGQGLANLVGSFFQSYPVSGSFSRTAVNFSAGAKTGVSSLFSSLMVVLTLLFLTPLLGLIPKAALAALVINAVWTLFHPKEVFRIWKMNKNDGMVAVTVFGLSLLTKPDYALMIGVVMSLIFFLWQTMHPRIVRETKDPNVNMFVNAEWMHQPSCPQILQLRVENPIYFANAEYVSEHILETSKKSPESTKFLLLDFQAVSFTDITGIDELKYLNQELKEKGLKMAISDLHQPVLEAFLRAGFTQEIEDGFLQKNKHEAIGYLVGLIDHDFCRTACPYSLFHECPELKKKPPQMKG